MAHKFSFDFTCADDVQFADEFDQADAIVHCAKYKFHNFHLFF
jgi:hypothetical protein